MKKQIIIAVASLMLVTPMMANPSKKECKETYMEIKNLLDKKLITIKDAQEMWIKWEKQHHKSNE